MLKLVIDGYHVEFYKKEEDSIQFNFYNPLYNSTNAIGLPDGTYPFLIPASNNNKKFFGYPYRIGQSPTGSPTGIGGNNYKRSSGVKPLNKIYKGWLYLGGMPRTAVNVQFIYASEKEFSIQCVVGNARLDAFINNTKIKDFISGEAGNLNPSLRAKVASLKYYVIGADSNGMDFKAVITNNDAALSTPAYIKGNPAANYIHLADVINANTTLYKCSAVYDPVSQSLILTAIGLLPDQRFNLSDITKDTSSGIYVWSIISENVSPADGDKVVMSTGRYKIITVGFYTVDLPGLTWTSTGFVAIILNNITYTESYTSGQNQSTTLDALVAQINADSINAGCTVSYDHTPGFGRWLFTFTAVLPGAENAFDSGKIETFFGGNKHPTSGWSWYWNCGIAGSGTHFDDYTWAQAYGDDIQAFLNAIPTAEPAPPYVFTPHYNPGFYDTGQNPDWLINKVINAYDVDLPGYEINYNTAIEGGSLGTNNNISGNTFHNYFTLVPFVKLSWVLQAIFAELGITVSSGFFDNAEIQSLVLYNNVSLDCLQTLKFDTADYQTCNLFTSTWYLHDHLPDMTIASLLNNLVSLFGLGRWYNYQKGIIQIEAINDYLSNERWDNKLKSPGLGLKWIGRKKNWNSLEDTNYEIEPPDEFSFSLQQQGDSSDKYQPLISYNVFGNDLTVDNVKNTGPVNITTAFSTLKMAQAQAYKFGSFGPDNIPQLMPWANQKGSSPMFNTGTNSFSPRLLFYRGMQVDNGGTDTYPLASADVYDGVGNIIGAYSLYYTGKFGLYELFYKKWIDLRLSNGRCIRTIYLTGKELARFNIHDKVLIRWHLFIIRSFKVSASPKSGQTYYPVKVELVLLRH